MVECVVTGARIADGSGASLFQSDLIIDNGLLKLVKPGQAPDAKRVISAKGLVAAPGFIDIHSHNDLVAVTKAELSDKVSQGVTTEVFGNCGFSGFPVTAANSHLTQQLTALIAPSRVSVTDDMRWPNWKEFSEAVRHVGTQANVVGQVGHIMLRSAVMGMSMREPNATELLSMQDILAQCLEEGASGLSFGLMYHPSSYAEREEIRALCQVVADHNAFVSVHLRGYDSKSLVTSMNELIWAAEVTGARLQLSHLSPTGRDAQGLTERMLEIVDQAVERGVDVALDRYPYDKGMSRLGLIIPKWVVADSEEAMLERLSDPDTVARMVPEIDAFVEHIGYDQIKLVRNCDPSLVGKTLSEASELMGMSPGTASARIMNDSRGLAGIILTLSTMAAQERVLKHELCMVGSDGIPSLEGTHPRTFGTFARVLGPFVRSGILTLEEAIYKMTGLPAERIGLERRGRIQNDFIADLVLFDPTSIRDESTFEKPYTPSSGIHEVFVAGTSVYRDGKALDAHPGRILTCRISQRKRNELS